MFEEPPGSYEICPICFWEDDISQLRFVTTAGGANRVSLRDAQRNFTTFGASEEPAKAVVRTPGPADRREPGWRPVDPALGDVEEPISRIDDGPTYPADSTTLYYWRATYWRKRATR